VFGDRLPRHLVVFAHLAKRLPSTLVQLIEQLSTAFVCQGFEYWIQLAQRYATKWLHVKRQTEKLKNFLSREVEEDLRQALTFVLLPTWSGRVPIDSKVSYTRVAQAIG
jgi:hypothetical protein